MPVDDALRFEHWIKTDTVSTVMVRDDETGEEREVHFAPSWPQMITLIHAADQYGSRPYAVSVPRSKKTPAWNPLALWCCVSIVVHTPPLWRSLCGMVSNTWEWPGWFLRYAASSCLTGCGQRGSRNNPFRKRVDCEQLHRMMFREGSYRRFSHIAVPVCLNQLPTLATASWTLFSRALRGGVYHGDKISADHTCLLVF